MTKLNSILTIRTFSLSVKRCLTILTLYQNITVCEKIKNIWIKKIKYFFYILKVWAQKLGYLVTFNARVEKLGYLVTVNPLTLINAWRLTA
jgi:hypothetical protein